MKIDYRSMSVEERARHRAALEAAEKADSARRNVAAVVALKWAIPVLREAGMLNQSWLDIAPQAYPKEKLAGKPADLSETELHEIEKAVVSALDGV